MLRFEHPAALATSDDCLSAFEGLEERLRTLEQELAECVVSDDCREAMGLLRWVCGIDTVTVLVELATSRGSAARGSSWPTSGS